MDRDWGFAPNPFFGFCTVACCKPTIRRVAEVGDIIVGTGTKSKGLSGRLVFVMRVTEKMDFQSYWADPRFFRKRPTMTKGRMVGYGDNIYQPDEGGNWTQIPSHHSLANGAENLYNKNKDTSSNHVLISDQYVYWGGDGPSVPNYLRDFEGVDLCAPTQGHISAKIFPEMADAVSEFLDGLGKPRIRGRPARWSKSADQC